MRKLLKPRWRKRWNERQVGFLVWKRHHQGWLDRSYGQRKREKTPRVDVREDQEHEQRFLWSLWTRIDQWHLWSQWRTVRLWPAGAPKHFGQAGPWVLWPSKGCLCYLKHSIQVSHLGDLTPMSSWGMSRKCQFIYSVMLREGRGAGAAPDSELGCPVMLRVSSKVVVKIVIAKALSWEKSGLLSLVNRTCVVSSLFSSRRFLKSSKCPLVGEIGHWKAGRGS